MVQNLRGKGFTLVEFLFVLGIICIILTISILNYSGYKGKAFDTLAQEGLQQAYSSAIAYFVDHPEGTLTLPDLEKYGFKASPNVKIRILDGRPSNLLMTSSYDAPGPQTYTTYYKGTQEPIGLTTIPGGGASASSPVNPQNTNPKGIESQSFISPVQAEALEKCNLEAKSNLLEAYSAAQAYFQVNREGTVTKDLLLAYGSTLNENVNLVIVNGTASDLSMSAIFNFPGATNYVIGPSGNIAPIP